jgi:hypothetical protein
VHGLDHQHLFAGEVAVDRGLGDPRSVGDLVDGGSFDTYLCNEISGNLEHGLACSLASGWCRLDHRYQIVASSRNPAM